MEGQQIGAIAGTSRGLAPVSKKWPWITAGLILQVIGVAAPAVYVLNKAHKEDFGGQLTRATVRLAWHQAVHSKAGLAVMIAGTVAFVVGSTLLARPYAKSWPLLLVAVPIAAVVGLLVLGAAVLIVALLVLAVGSLFDGGGGSGGSSSGGSSGGVIVGSLLDTSSTPGTSRRRKRDEDEQPSPAA